MIAASDLFGIQGHAMAEELLAHGRLHKKDLLTNM